MRNADSVKDRLKNYAQKSRRTFQDVLTVYTLERILYRLSVSEYRESFTLKGGILLHGLFTEEFSRATTDIDLLGRMINNDAENMKAVFKGVLGMETDDPIRFDLDAIEAINITEFKKYHGIRLTTFAYLDKTRIPVGIDIGFGDVIYPGRVTMEYPTLIDDEPPVIYTYSLESVIAEKLEAIVSFGEVNSRYKDFYDISMIADRCDFRGTDLQEAVKETLENRHTSLERIVAFEPGYADDPARQTQWSAFLKKKKVTVSKSLPETVNDIKCFAEPVLEAFQDDCHVSGVWNHLTRKWE